MAGSLDAATEGETSFPPAPLVTYEADSRRELSLHGRYAGSTLELDARVDLLRTRAARTELGISSALRQTVATLRLDALLAPVAGTRWRPRLGVRGVGGEAVGNDAGVSFRLTRREPSARIAAQREDGAALWEVGYALAVPVLRQTGGGPALDTAPYQDKLYGSCDLGFGSISLRGLLSWEIRNARFGGANANVLMQF